MFAFVSVLFVFRFYSREEEKVEEEEIKEEQRTTRGNFADLKDEDKKRKAEKCQEKYRSRTDKERREPNKLK